jgi:uncharacterized protein (DUF924 family)
MTPQTVLYFWYQELEPKQWFIKDETLDHTIESRFGDLHRKACMNELAFWRESPEGRLAEIIVLDQFSRNLHRDTPAAFAQDAQALALAQEALQQNADQSLTSMQRCFMYMPFMHSESKKIHETAEHLFKALGEKPFYDSELRHKAIIDRFGRYPHRNEVLGRASTEEELAFLKEPNSSF